LRRHRDREGSLVSADSPGVGRVLLEVPVPACTSPSRRAFFFPHSGRTMDRMAAFPIHAVEKARDHVARSAYLIDRQEAIIQALERSGADTRLACAMLYTMYRSRLLMIEYLDQVKRVDSAGRKAAVLQADLNEHRNESHPHQSVDEWLQLLTLAMNPHQGPHGPH